MTSRTRTIEEIRTHLWKCVTSEGFRRGQGLGAEPPVFLAAYSPRLDSQIAELVEVLRGLAAEVGLKVGVFDVFQSFLDSVHQSGQADDYFELENAIAGLGKQRITASLESALDLKTVFAGPFNSFVGSENYDVIFVAGFTGAYPHVRASQVSAALEGLTHQAPVVLFVPGTTRNETGHLTLKLFDVLDERHNYRATDIFDYQPAPTRDNG